MNKKTLFDTLIVVKRSGQRTSFQGEKIAIAIQKAFSSLDIPYHDEDVNKVYEKVLHKIEKDYQGRKTINIENIQDIIEAVLKQEKFQDVYEAFSTYRNHRNASRKTFVIKQQHKFLKAIESLGWTNISQEDKTSAELLERFGSVISLEFAKAYLLDNKIVRAHDSGLIHLHSIETMPIGSIENLEIDLEEIEQLDTPLAHLLTSQSNIYDYLIQITKLINHMINEQYEGISFIHFDNDLERIAKVQLHNYLLESLSFYIKINELEPFISLEKIERELDKTQGIDDISTLLSLAFEKQTKRIIDLQEIINLSIERTKEIIKQSLQAFLTTLPSIPISFNFGTNTTFLGKIINKCLIETASLQTNIQYFFKVKQNISYQEGDPNYDLLCAYTSLSLTHQNCYYAFLDSSFNKLEHEEICYLSCGKRVIDDNTTLEKKIVGGKGNLATVSINLVRIALKSQKDGTTNKRLFYQNLEQTLCLAKDALLARFELQCNRCATNFPYLYQEGLWHDGEKIKEQDRLRKLLKHGSLTVHFCGLNEVINLLSPQDDQQKLTSLSLEIIKYIRKKLDQFSDDNNLNFTLSAVEYEQIAIEFKKQDTAIFGKIKGVTDREAYSRGDDLDISIENMGKLQNLLNGGHLLKMTANQAAIMSIIKSAREANIGCLYITKEKWRC